MKNLYIILLILVYSFAFTQQSNNNVTLGYYCGYSGNGTPIVNNVSELLLAKKYKSIKSSLYSKIPAENFLGYAICKRLEFKKLITFTELDLKKISELLKSNEKVPICGGCTYNEEVKLSKLMNSKEEIFQSWDYFFEKENNQIKK